MQKPPVVFLVFNRPGVTAEVFAAIRAYRPAQLFVVCDAPRAHKTGEAEKVAAVRRLITDGVDWPCELHCDFAEQNLGCRDRIASGLNAVFARVESAIILEDDCLPSPGFFTYCEAMLERYRDDARIVHIGGTNMIAPYHQDRTSYWFTRHSWIWGWATWRRAWETYDFTMSTWRERLPLMTSTFASRWESQYWLSTWDEARRDLQKANTWGFPWMYSCRSSGGLSILPRENLIRNLGFSADSTHTREDMNRLDLSLGRFEGPIVHPSTVAADRYKDELFTRVYCGAPLDFRSNLKSRLRTWFAAPAPAPASPAPAATA